MAARTAAYGKAAYGWGVKRGALSVNPFSNLPVTPIVKRERVLAARRTLRNMACHETENLRRR